MEAGAAARRAACRHRRAVRLRRSGPSERKTPGRAPNMRRSATGCRFSAAARARKSKRCCGRTASSDVGSDPVLDLVEAQADRMVEEGRERQTRRRYVAWGEVPALSCRGMLLRVRSITYLAQRINGYELVDREERDLPRIRGRARTSRCGPATGPVRDFSLWNDPAERSRYCIARASRARGARAPANGMSGCGSAISSRLSGPRNNFPLRCRGRAPSDDRRRHRHHADHGDDRGVARAAAPISACITAPARPRRRRFSTISRSSLLSGGCISTTTAATRQKGSTSPRLLREYRPGTHLYYCGPAGMMAAAEAPSHIGRRERYIASICGTKGSAANSRDVIQASGVSDMKRSMP